MEMAQRGLVKDYITNLTIYIMLQPINYRNYAKIRHWRNLAEVRSMMFTKHEIFKEEHDIWWEKTKNDSSKLWLMFSRANEDLGVVYFIDINDKTKTAYWGFYLADDEVCSLHQISKKRIWLDIEKEAIEYAKDILGLEQLFCEVLGENKAVIKLHEKSGFKDITPHHTSGARRFLLQFSQMKNPG
jgi:UDP-4-amino-4,6-dideoxy-N-acetyl-beta-L-altrosamine N-acetyltransferase